jgi:Phosphotransferase enzyme family
LKLAPLAPPRAPRPAAPFPLSWDLPATGTGVAHDLAVPARARERMLLPQLAAWLPVPRLLGRLGLPGQECAVYSRLGDADLQDVLPRDASTPPAPSGTGPSRALTESSLARLLGQLGTVLASLHSVPVAEFDGAARWARDPEFRLLQAPGPAQIRAYTRSEADRALARAAAGGHLTERRSAVVAEALADCPAVAPDSLALVHFDLHPRNVRIALADGRFSLAGLIDFKNAHYWMPEFDLVTVGWQLSAAPAAAGAFLAAYESSRNRPVDPALMRLCELIRLAFVLANAPRRDPAWVAWCARRWDTLADAGPAPRRARPGEAGA